jgi:hypothetical protein
MHLDCVLEMAESSPDKKSHEQKINDRLRMEQQLDLPMAMPAQQEAAGTDA